MNREDIYAALFAKLAALAPATLTTVDRRLKHIEDCQPSDFPAAYQVQQDEVWTAKANLPTTKVLHVDWWLYVYEPDANAVPSTQLNALMDAVDGVLGQDNGGLTVETLNGRVYTASVSGTIEVFEGVLGDRAMAIVPIRIVKAD